MRIYLDHNATTPLRPEVVDVMSAVLRDHFGNPSSTHEEGSAARRIVDEAREAVAALLGGTGGQLTFTAGATEANNMVLASLDSEATPWTRLITTAIEHPSVREPAARLGERGIAVQALEVDASGRISMDALEAALAAGPALVSVLWANNETGTLQEIDAIAEGVCERGSWLHVDATQALGKVDVAGPCAKAHFVSCSAHKLNGPKGSGALLSRAPVSLPAHVAGGPQERRGRGGTENVAGIAGFAQACELALGEGAQRAARYADLRDRLWETLRAKVPELRWNGVPEEVAGDAGQRGAWVLPNTLNVEFCGAAGDVLLQALDIEGVAVSAGAACHSGSVDPSHVLVAMGRAPEEARAALRLSLGYGNDEAQIDRAADRIAELVPRAREVMSP